MDYSNMIEPDEIRDEPYIFVSYSRRDMELAQEVIRILKQNGFRFWYDKGLKSGTEWAEELGGRIDRCAQFLVLISANSVNSKYVRKEIGMATDSDKNILVLYLEETDLTKGLHLLLGNIQAIHKEYFNNERDFESAICEAASNSTLFQGTSLDEESNDGTAKKDLMMHYKILSQIGEGGLSKVYIAEHRRTGAVVVVKGGLVDESYKGSITKICFMGEKIALRTLMENMCPYTPILLDWFEDERQVFLVESFVDGKSLWESGVFSEEEVVSVARSVLGILRYLHDNNIIYGDLKPKNLILDKNKTVYMIDFNAVMWTNEVQTRILMGTPGYSPPEQYNRNMSIDFSSDIYALGRTIMYLLCQENFSPVENIRTPIRYYRKDISPELERILWKMTAPKQEDRYQNVRELLRALESYKIKNPLARIFLFIKSRSNIRKYENTIRKRNEAHKSAVNELAQYPHSSREENLGNTNTMVLM